MVHYVFDGSLEGLLTAVFEYYERKPRTVRLSSAQRFEPVLIDEVFEIASDESKAKRVWEGLRKKTGNEGIKRFYVAYLSEDETTFRHLFDYARYIFDHAEGADRNFGNASVVAVSQMERSVMRERHRMKAFIRFQETTDGIFYAPIEPDFNVLPLISKFFKDRYANQRWIIYDLRRNYGLFYDLETVEEIVLEQRPEMKSSTFLEADVLHEKEHLYGLLWNDYFKSINIPARKNMKLHIRHVPKRYWKYLTEKQEMDQLYFIAIIAPPEVAAQITAIKQDFADRFGSRHALKTVPHLTLKAPFRMTDDEAHNLTTWFAKLELQVPAFTVELDGFGAFHNEHAVVFVKPEPCAELMALQHRLLAHFESRFEYKSQSIDRDFHPHMTVALRDLSSERFADAWDEYKDRVLKTAFEVGEISLLRHDGTAWKVIATKGIA